MSWWIIQCCLSERKSHLRPSTVVSDDLLYHYRATAAHNDGSLCFVRRVTGANTSRFSRDVRRGQPGWERFASHRNRHTHCRGIDNDDDDDDDENDGNDNRDDKDERDWLENRDAAAFTECSVATDAKKSGLRNERRQFSDTDLRPVCRRLYGCQHVRSCFWFCRYVMLSLSDEFNYREFFSSSCSRQ